MSLIQETKIQYLERRMQELMPQWYSILQLAKVDAEAALDAGWARELRVGVIDRCFVAEMNGLSNDYCYPDNPNFCEECRELCLQVPLNFWHVAYTNHQNGQRFWTCLENIINHYDEVHKNK